MRTDSPLASLVALGLSLAACSSDPVAAPVAPAPVAAIAPPVIPPLRGVVAARATELVAARIDGRITRVIAARGQRVRAGDPLAELDPTLLDERRRAAVAAVEAARADHAGAIADVAEAQRQVALEQRMFAAGATAAESVRVASARLAKSRAAQDRSAAALREAEASLASTESQLSYTHVAAPIDGVVSLVKAQAGEVVAPGVAIARVFDPDSLMIRFQVTHEHQHEIASGVLVELTVGSTGHPLRARVTSVSADLEPPLDFAVAEANIVDPGAARGVQIGTLVDVRVVDEHVQAARL
ncbi:MAG TPA: HlyD family efflux transporter periplasmic adaptor subunit [Kofleriaceae bacterium]|nr:HlyD family efflux transporter periplasmic adaptor subunit [Kofleriaceae bacterium]